MPLPLNSTSQPMGLTHTKLTDSEINLILQTLFAKLDLQRYQSSIDLWNSHHLFYKIHYSISSKTYTIQNCFQLLKQVLFYGLKVFLKQLPIFNDLHPRTAFSNSFFSHSSFEATRAIMATNDNMFHFKVGNSILDNRSYIQINWVYNLGNIAMDKHPLNSDP